jgi:5-methylcytosine-specific restriction protein A
MIDARRGTSTERGYDARWQRARYMYLNDHPLCVMCLTENRTVAATIVDHIQPHHNDYRLMWSDSNWQALCTRHHSIKTATTDHAFGNK